MTTFGNLSATIHIGGAATQDTGAVAELLHGAADRLAVRDWADIEARSLPIIDANGNIVGHLSLTGFSIVDEEDGE